MPNALDISTATESDLHAWDEYVLSQPSSCFYQSSMWARFLTGHLGFGQASLVARRGGKIVGVLPLFLVSKFPLGSKLISIPFNMTAGGVVSEDPEVHAALLKAALETGRNCKAKYLEIRQATGDAQAMAMGFAQRKPFLFGEIPLTGHDENYKRLNPKRRRNLKHCRKAGVRISQSFSLDELRNYYDRVLTPHFKHKGSPWVSFKFLKAIWEQGGPPKRNVVLITARLDDAVIGGNILYCYGDTLMQKIQASLPQYWKMGVNASLVWAGIEYGNLNRYRVLNYGISDRDQHGQLHFKKDMGSDVKDTFSYTYAFHGSPMNLENFSENRTRFVRKIWTLAPRILTDLMGPSISNWLC